MVRFSFVYQVLSITQIRKIGLDKVFVDRQTWLTIDLILMLEIIIMYESSDMDHRGLGLSKIQNIDQCHGLVSSSCILSSNLRV